VIIACVSSFGFIALIRREDDFVISPNDEFLEVIVGVPQACASMICIPKPSYLDGRIRAFAFLRSAGRSLSFMKFIM